jgi:hypothetical protein
MTVDQHAGCEIKAVFFLTFTAFGTVDRIKFGDPLALLSTSCKSRESTAMAGARSVRSHRGSYDPPLARAGRLRCGAVLPLVFSLHQ